MNYRFHLNWKIWVGLALFVLVLLLPQIPGLTVLGQRMIAVTVLMSFWWITEAISISATALLPLALFPILGIMEAKKVAAPFANDLIFLFMGGFMIAIAIQRWGLDKRIALRTVKLIGFSQSRLVLGFMVATGFLSMWISNTATAMIMVPIAIAVLNQLKKFGDSTSEEKHTSFARALLLGIAYSASIGGIGTLIGTPPNLVLANIVEKIYNYNINFVKWMMVGIPFVIVFLPITWFYLTKIAFKLDKRAMKEGKVVIQQELKSLGPMTSEEKWVSLVFTAIVIMWIMSEPKDFGGFVIPGIRSFLPMISDGTIGMFGALLLFLIPAKKEKGRGILTWKEAREIPWGILMLFGGGLTLAEGFTVTKLSDWVGSQVTVFANAPHFIPIFANIALIVFLTEFTSNTATVAMMLPILAGVADGIGLNPFILMIPATLAASCGFMLPAGTPPNAIIFGTGYLNVPTMARVGLAIDLLGIVAITLVSYFIVTPVFVMVR